MDADRFDALCTILTTVPSRRAALRVLAGLGLAGLAGRAEAKKKKRKKKKCAKAGKKASKKRKKCCKGLVKDATKRCSCTPGSCPANQICLIGGTCQPCTVTCTGTPAECGAALQTAMDGGGTVYACPGNYRGGFILNNAVRVFGAGEGEEPASNTILDANDMGRVLLINSGGGTVELERLRLTDGNTSGSGTGIAHLGDLLRMTECTVSGNNSDGLGAGAGIAVQAGSTLEMTRCTIRDNHASGMNSQGGGMYVLGTVTLTDCLVADNRATVEGGGMFIGSGSSMPTVTLLGSTQVRDNAAEFGAGIFVGGSLEIAETCRVTENTAAAPGNGGGIFSTAGSTVILQGAPGTTSPIVANNCHENCAGAPVSLCAATPISCPP